MMSSTLAERVRVPEKGTKMSSVKLGVKSDGFERKGQAWFCTTGLPSDITVEVDDMLFHLHKFPLISRSGRLTKLVSEACGDDEEEECRIRLQAMPGGSQAFELAAKFCYGVRVELAASNVAALRCAAEYLEMTEEYGEENLIAVTESFLNQVVVRSWKDSVRTLKSCERLLPQAEELQIVKKCVDSITMKACNDPSLFGWPMVEKCALQSPGGTLLWNGISTGARPRNSRLDWWYEDVSVLNLPLFKCVVRSMEEKGLRNESISGGVMYYAKKSMPGLNRRQDTAFRVPVVASMSTTTTTVVEQRLLLETIESLLPTDEGITSTRFLFGLLRTAMILNASEACKTNLERRIGAQLEQATVDDLVIPNYSSSLETLYDIDCVQRILDRFLLSDKALSPPMSPLVAEDGQVSIVERSSLVSPLMTVAKLLDSYLAEVAPDVNLKPMKFQSLAEAVPDNARVLDDGLYRAIDVFLKAHAWLTEAERERLCNVMDCQKLSLEACTHAAQNERLPLRTVVQVLFFEQLQLRAAIEGVGVGAGGAAGDTTRAVAPPEGRGGWASALLENQALRVDMASMRRRVAELERESGVMRQKLRQKLAGWAKLGCASPSDDVVRSSAPAAASPRRHHRRRQSADHQSSPLSRLP